MTKEEAIKLLDCARDILPNKAVDMAIEALSEETSTITKDTQCQEKNDHSGEVTEMVDLIRREDVIEVLMGTIAPPSVTLDTLVMRIDALPSAEPKTGEWIYAKEQLEIVPIWECSCCRIRMRKKFNYCPNCGADMRERIEE